MVQLIHLSLLLATTIQLPLVSVTHEPLKKVTVKLPPQWTVKRCCRENKCKGVSDKRESNPPGVKVTNSGLTIKLLKTEDRGIYLSYDASHTNAQTEQCLYLKVTRALHTVCVELYLCEADCRKLCTDDPTSPNFTRCNKKSFFVSQSKTVDLDLEEHIVPECLPRYSSGNMTGLRFYQEAKSWIDALEHCENQKSSLVQITSQTVQDAVDALLKNKTDWMQHGAWIGLERSIFGQSVPWMLISGSKANFSQWNSSFPVDRFNNHCGKIIWVKESQEFKWLDGYCHDELPFICQADPT